MEFRCRTPFFGATFVDALQTATTVIPDHAWKPLEIALASRQSSAGAEQLVCSKDLHHNGLSPRDFLGVLKP